MVISISVLSPSDSFRRDLSGAKYTLGRFRPVSGTNGRHRDALVCLSGRLVLSASARARSGTNVGGRRFDHAPGTRMRVCGVTADSVFDRQSDAPIKAS